MNKDFIMPDWEKMLTYLSFVVLFMSETLVIRTLFQRDFVMIFLLNIYNSFFSGMVNYVNFFTISFAYYLIVLFVLYVLSCFVILIIGKIKE